MKFISFFAGIGGIDLGLERAGHECVCQVEIDPYCIKVLEKHWPNVQRFKDITKLTGAELPEAELWAGGFPCQDVSIAGKRAGIHGERSGLFFEFMRLVRVVRPKCLLLENVPGILSSGHGRVQGELAEAGYHALWDQLSAAEVGALHLRKRWFCVCWRWGDKWPFRELADTEELRLEEQRQEGREQVVADGGGEVLANTKKQLGNAHNNHRVSRPKQMPKLRNGDKKTKPLGSWWAVEPDVGRVANGVPRRVDRLRCLGNAVVPQVAEFIGRLL